MGQDDQRLSVCMGVTYSHLCVRVILTLMMHLASQQEGAM
jgi:hypothetical protein